MVYKYWGIDDRWYGPEEKTPKYTATTKKDAFKNAYKLVKKGYPTVRITGNGKYYTVMSDPLERAKWKGKVFIDSKIRKGATIEISLYLLKSDGSIGRKIVPEDNF